MIPSFERFLTWWVSAVRVSRLAWVIAGSLLWWSTLSPVQGAQPFVKIQPGVDGEFASDVEFQTAETDADSGAVFVAGTFVTRLDLSPSISLVAPFKGVPQAFLAKQSVDGSWEWAVLAYAGAAPSVRNGQGARSIPTESQEVKDIEVTADGIARVRLHGACCGCAMSPMTMKAGVEEAIKRVAPSIKSVEAVNMGEVV